jgi:hypothetical protein
MVAPIDLSSKNEVLRLRNILERVSDISFSYSQINKNYPLSTLDQKDVDEMIKFYHNLIQDLHPILETYRNEFTDQDESNHPQKKVARPVTSGVAYNG